MKSELLLKKADDLWENLITETNSFHNNTDSLGAAQHALMVTDSAIRKLKSWVKTHQFDTWEREIRFFKQVKPKFVGKFILFSRIIAVESSLPYAGNKLARKEYENEFFLLHQFSKENSEFISYWRKKSTYLDSKYFRRYRYDLYTKLSVDLHSYDESFATSHDNLVAQILANEEYENYLIKKIKKLRNSSDDIFEPFSSPLKWTGSKVELAELLLALNLTSCFNGGNIETSILVREIEKNWNVDLGNYYKTVSDIKNRKIHRVKFLQKLTDSLNIYFENSDE